MRGIAMCHPRGTLTWTRARFFLGFASPLKYCLGARWKVSSSDESHMVCESRERCYGFFFFDGGVDYGPMETSTHRIWGRGIYQGGSRVFIRRFLMRESHCISR